MKLKYCDTCEAGRPHNKEGCMGCAHRHPNRLILVVGACLITILVLWAA